MTIYRRVGRRFVALPEGKRRWGAYRTIGQCRHGCSLTIGIVKEEVDGVVVKEWLAPYPMEWSAKQVKGGQA